MAFLDVLVGAGEAVEFGGALAGAAAFVAGVAAQRRLSYDVLRR